MAKTSFQMFGVIIILGWGEGVTSFPKGNSANFSKSKIIKWSLPGSLYLENTRKNLKVKSRTRSRPQSLNLKLSNCYLRYPHCTVEPRFNEPLYNEVLGITNDFLQPGQRYNKMYGITNTIKKRNVEYNMSTCDRKIAKGECETDQCG